MNDKVIIETSHGPVSLEQLLQLHEEVLKEKNDPFGIKKLSTEEACALLEALHFLENTVMDHIQYIRFKNDIKRKIERKI